MMKKHMNKPLTAITIKDSLKNIMLFVAAAMASTSNKDEEVVVPKTEAIPESGERQAE